MPGMQTSCANWWTGAQAADNGTTPMAWMIVRRYLSI